MEGHPLRYQAPVADQSCETLTRRVLLPYLQLV